MCPAAFTLLSGSSNLVEDMCAFRLNSTIETLSEYVVSTRYDSLPGDVQLRAQHILLDTLGAILSAAAPHYTTSQRILQYTLDQGGHPESILIGSNERTSCVNAALYNGTLGYSSDIESHHPGAIMHGAAIVVPAALAVAERQRSSGSDLLTAVVLGIEVACRVSLAIDPTILYSRGQHPTCIAGGFGSATAAGYLLGLTSSELCQAWGLTGTQASGLLAWETDPTENSRPFNPGIASRNGTTAAVLASYGFGGPPDIFEGKFNILNAFSDESRPDLLTERLGKRFMINELAIKRYACCAFLHPGLDGLEQILTAQNLQANEIDAIRLRFPRSGVALIDNNPLRSHCGQYILPIYALERKIIIDDILTDRRNEPAISSLSQKVQVLGDDELDREFPDRYTTHIEVDSRGHTFSQLVRYAKGCPENPLTIDELEAKFRRLAGTVIENEEVETVLHEIRTLSDNPTVEHLAAHLQIPR